MQRFLTITLLAGFPLLSVAQQAYNFTGAPTIEDAGPILTGLPLPPAPAARVRMATYNIENFEDGVGDNKERTPAVAKKQASMAAAILDKVAADIVIIEEVENADALTHLNQAMTTPYPEGFVTSYGTGSRRGEKLNDGVLSRVPLSNVRVIDFGTLAGPGRPTRGLLNFIVDLGGGEKLLVYGVHLKSNYGKADRNVAERQHALEILRADADRIRKESPDVKWEVVVAGDFNVDPDVPEFKDDTTLSPLSDWTDLWRGRPIEERTTLPIRHGDPRNEYPSAAFDRFIVSPELKDAPWRALKTVAQAEGSDTNNVFTLPGHGSHVSDHYPVYLDIVK